MATVQRRLSVIVAADVVGYSRLMGEDELGTLVALKAHREAIDPIFAEDGGRIVKTTGDGLLLEFPSAFHAVRAALGVQRVMAERNADVPPEKRMIFRMGIHLGDVIVDDDDIFGDGVNIAARLQEIAEPGGICMSQPVHGTIHKNIDALFRDGGNKMLKNIAAPVHIFNLALDGAVSEPPKPAVPAVPPLISTVVLPFANLSGDPRQDYFVDSVTDHLIDQLAKLDSSFVVPRVTAFAYRGEAAEPAQIARELGVRFVVRGSIRVADGRFRINAQLIDAEDGRHLWVDRFDLAVGDPFSMQHDIVSRMLPPLRGQLLAATGRAPPPQAAAPPHPRPAPASARPAQGAAVVLHPRGAAPIAERRTVLPARQPAATTAAPAPAPAAPKPPAPTRTVRVPTPPLANPRAAEEHRPWLWGAALAVAALALVAAIVLAIFGVRRALVIETVSWVLLVAGAVQMLSLVARSLRRS